MEKATDFAFGKQVYLLGKDANGVKYWLEAPTWDCGWYWGFGYIETYQQNWSPSKARDIDSHQHADGKYIAGNAAGTGKRYNDDDNLFTGDFLTEKTFSEADGWQLRELFAQFYHLKTQGEFYGRGGMHITTLPTQHAMQDKEQAKKVNTLYIPMVIKNILQLLSPDQKTLLESIDIVNAQKLIAEKDIANAKD